MKNYTTGDNLQVPYEDTGSGLPLLLIPGWTMSRKSFSKQFSDPKFGFRVIVPDLRGQGDSPKEMLDKVSLETWADDVHELMQQLELKKVVLVGWSLGALTMWVYRHCYPQDPIIGLVHIDMVPHFSARWAEWKNQQIDLGYPVYMKQFVDQTFFDDEVGRQFFFGRSFKNSAVRRKKTQHHYG